LSEKLFYFLQQSSPGEAEQIVRDAIDIGYRHIDCAMFYENEKEVGAGVRAKIAEGVIKREDIFVTSKVTPVISPLQILDFHHEQFILECKI
jgi:diketogulonate reductase-like aldo/keto reductase